MMVFSAVAAALVCPADDSLCFEHLVYCYPLALLPLSFFTRQTDADGHFFVTVNASLRLTPQGSW